MMQEYQLQMRHNIPDNCTMEILNFIIVLLNQHKLHLGIWGINVDLWVHTKPQQQ